MIGEAVRTVLRSFDPDIADRRFAGEAGAHARPRRAAGALKDSAHWQETVARIANLSVAPPLVLTEEASRAMSVSLDADLYRRLLETSPEGVVLVDALHPDHPVIYVNPAFEALTGLLPPPTWSAATCDCCRPRTASRTAAIDCARRCGSASPAACCCATTARTARCSGTK